MSDLHSYQQQAVETIDRFGGRSLLAIDMGLGKTAIALSWIARNNAWPAVVVCPSSVKYHWEREAFRWAGVEAVVLEGEKAKPFPSRPQLVVINYDILVPSRRRKQSKEIPSWLDELLDVNPKTIVIDESQYVGNPTAVRTRAVRELCQDRPHVLAQSGTPLVARPIELWPALQMVYPFEFTSRWTFARRFCAPRLTKWGWVYKGATNTKELNLLLTRLGMVRIRKQDVLKDLPDVTLDVMPMMLRRPGEYIEAKNNFLLWLGRRNPKRLQKAEKAEALVKVGYLLRLAARLKSQAVVEWVDEFLNETNEKLVLFCNHRGMVDVLHRRCNGESVIVDGSVTGRKRDAVVRQFRVNKKTRLLVANTESAGVGLDGLQRSCSNLAFAELPWTPGAVDQGIGRLHRIGAAGDKVFVWFLVARGTIEQRLCELLQQRQDVVSTILDGGKVKRELPIADMLVRGMKSE